MKSLKSTLLIAGQHPNLDACLSQVGYCLRDAVLQLVLDRSRTYSSRSRMKSVAVFNAQSLIYPSHFVTTWTLDHFQSVEEQTNKQLWTTKKCGGTDESTKPG
jgi:hypothetical protein